MGKLRIAVSSCGGASGYGICQCAALLPYPVEIFPVDVTPHSVGLFMGTQMGTVLPKPEQNIEAWIDFVHKNDIDALIPGADRDLMALASYAEETRAIISSPEAIAICDDKLTTACFMDSIGVTVPDYNRFGDDWDKFPCVVKPRCDAASRGFHICQDQEELDFYLRHTNKPMIQEYIGGDEITANVFTDNNGEPVAHLAMLRKDRAGIAVEARPIEDETVRAMLFKIARALKPKGVLSVQLKKIMGIPYPFEINCRMSGSSIVRALAGYNDLQFMLDHFLLGKDVAQPTIDYTKTYFRWYDVVSAPTEQVNGLLPESATAWT